MPTYLGSSAIPKLYVGSTPVTAVYVGTTRVYSSIPTITNLSPQSGNAGSTRSVTITGTNFVSGATVSVGGTAATSVWVASATSITCTFPSKAKGDYNVTVTTSGGTSNTLSTRYVGPLPAITGFSPNPVQQGQNLTITGTNFDPTYGTFFSLSLGPGSRTPTSLTKTSAVIPMTSVSTGTCAIQPANNFDGWGSGSNVSVIAPIPAPTYTGITIPQGIAGLQIIVSGTNFISGTTVTVGGVSATTTINSTTQLTVTIPTISGEGAKSIVITTPGGTATGTNVFTYYNTQSPATTTYTSAGSGNYTIPAWCNKIDVVVMGGGGAGGGSNTFAWGSGGSAGQYNYVTLTRGSAIPWGTTSLAYTVAAGGIGSGGDGGSGGASIGHTTQANGGGGGVSKNNGGNGSGTNAYTWQGVTYPAASGGTYGNSADAGPNPGSGGGGGNSALGPFLGKNGRAGAVYFRAYQ